MTIEHSKTQRKAKHLYDAPCKLNIIIVRFVKTIRSDALVLDIYKVANRDRWI